MVNILEEIFGKIPNPIDWIKNFFYNIIWGWIDKINPFTKPGGQPDIWMSIPIILHILISVLLNHVYLSFGFILRLLVVLLGAMVPYYIIEKKRCGDTLKIDNYVNILTNASFTTGAAHSMMFFGTIASYFPFIGTPFSLLELLTLIPYVGMSLLWGVHFTFYYIVYNVINYWTGSNKYCSSGDLYDWARYSYLTTGIGANIFGNYMGY